MALYTKEGYRFENEEQAIHWFLSTLDDKTPLGDFYDKLHKEDWGDYDIQATGESEQEFHIFLDAPDHDAQVYRRVNVNTYGSDSQINYDELIEQLKDFKRAADITAIVTNGEISKIAERIKKKDNGLLTDVVTDFNNVVLTVSVEGDLFDSRVIIALTDKETGLQMHSSLSLVDDNRVDTEQIPALIESMFDKSIEGEFDGENLSVGGKDLEYLLNYATLNKSKVKVQIIN